MRRCGGKGYPIGKHQLPLQTGNAPAPVKSGTGVGIRTDGRIEMSVFHQWPVEIRQPRCFEAVGNDATVTVFKGCREDPFPRPEAEVKAVLVEPVDEFDGILSSVSKVLD